MNEFDKEKLIEKDIKAVENRIRHAFNQGYEVGLKHGKEQEPKTGHWIELGYVGNDNYDFECSECYHTDTQSKTVKVNYCWYCGAKMIEPQERSNKE